MTDYNEAVGAVADLADVPVDKAAAVLKAVGILFAKDPAKGLAFLAGAVERGSRAT